LKEWNECPDCGFKGLMICWQSTGYTGRNYKCPECKNVFGNLKKVNNNSI